jgi:predicted alpha/beta-hydrolase family hydrolase
VTQIDTPHGPARVQAQLVDDPLGALVLGHGAGGGVDAPDLVVVTEAALAARVGVVLVEQPYRVAGRRAPAPANQLDAAWLAVIAHLRDGPLRGLPLVAGGRSAGARVACRTAAEAGAAGVLCLAFPVHPPGRPEKTRLSELDGLSVPVLVVQGQSDPFGMPPPGPNRQVVTVPGNHSLKAGLDAVRAAVLGWLPAIVKGGAAD